MRKNVYACDVCEKEVAEFSRLIIQDFTLSFPVEGKPRYEDFSTDVEDVCSINCLLSAVNQVMQRALHARATNGKESSGQDKRETS